MSNVRRFLRPRWFGSAILGTMRLLPLPRSLPGTLALAALLTACDPPPPAVRSEPPPVRVEEVGRVNQTKPSDLKERQAAFLNRMRDADPQGRTIDRALLNEQNELGLILDRSVEMDKIPALMRTMLTQMAKEFPGQDLVILAYTPSNPPRKIGTARLKAATRDMTYTPEG